jgi:hypothetical protein
LKLENVPSPLSGPRRRGSSLKAPRVGFRPTAHWV